MFYLLLFYFLVMVTCLMGVYLIPKWIYKVVKK